MNRIILIGNGFDLAHGLKTSYRDFIEWLWETEATKVKNNKGSFEDDFIAASGTWCFLQENATNYQDLEYNSGQGSIKVKCKNKFLEQITAISTLKNWVDIEEEYFTQLKTIIDHQRMPDLNKSQYYGGIKELNEDLERIKKALEEYLIGELKNFKSDGFDLKNISQKFNTMDFMSCGIDDKQALKKYSHSINTPYEDCETPIYPNKTLFLNFNYTDLPIKLIKYIESNAGHLDDWAKNSFYDLFIHGELENKDYPIIFGYGDERSGTLVTVEGYGGEYWDNIKTINYFQTQNYKRLSDFIDEDQYQIFIWGHSCGSSDRTLLHTLFERKNCVSIKPFYYINEKGYNNYEDIIKNIYRCFTNKVLMRDKVVNKSYCSEL
jgi:hypothetical protein